MTHQIAKPNAYQPLSRVLKRLAVVVTLLFAALILVLALSPSVPSAASGINDKVLHFTAFAALVLPCAIFLARHLLWIAPLASIFGGAIELLQPWFGRQASWADFQADLIGVAFGIVAGLLFRFLIKRAVVAPKS